MQAFEIKLQAGSQKITANLGGVAYQLRIVWRASGYFLDVFLNDVLLIGGLPMTVGHNLLAQHQHVIKGALVMTTIDGSEPVYSGLGSLTRLFWVVL